MAFSYCFLKMRLEIFLGFFWMLYSEIHSTYPNNILTELSWPAKIKLLNFNKGQNLKVKPEIEKKSPFPRRVGVQTLIKAENIDAAKELLDPELKEKQQLFSLSGPEIVGDETKNTGLNNGNGSLNEIRETMSRRQADIPESAADPRIPSQQEVENADEGDMKIKLFRLMYETVRDSDVKVRRAELIKSSYNNNTAFEIGYLMGDITDKINIMTDVAETLTGLHDMWKPMEHINAYEQISNQAIEISQLIEAMRAFNRPVPIPIK